MSEMSLAERHSRIRAHDDLNTVMAADKFVAENFGGDYDRAAYFFAELALMEGGRDARFYSLNANEKRPFYPLKEN